MTLYPVNLAINTINTTCQWIRPHLDLVLESSLDEIKKTFDQALQSESEAPLTKKNIVNLTETIQSSALWGERSALGGAVICYFLSTFVPFISTALTACAIASLFIAYDIHQLNHSILQFKKWIKNQSDDGQINPENIKISLEKCLAELQNKALFISRSGFYGNELASLPAWVEQKLNPNEEGAQSIQNSEFQTIQTYIEITQTQIKTLFKQKQIKASELYALINQVLRPLAFVRAAGIALAIFLYMISAYLPIFSSLVFLQSLVVAFIAWECHQVHACAKAELSDWLIQSWDDKINDQALIQKVKDCKLMIQESSWIVTSQFLLGRQIESLPTLVMDLRSNKTFPISNPTLTVPAVEAVSAIQTANRLISYFGF